MSHHMQLGGTHDYFSELQYYAFWHGVLGHKKWVHKIRLEKIITGPFQYKDAVNIESTFVEINLSILINPQWDCLYWWMVPLY